MQQLLQLSDELPPAAPVRGGLQARGGHRHQRHVPQLQRHCQAERWPVRGLAQTRVEARPVSTRSGEAQMLDGEPPDHWSSPPISGPALPQTILSRATPLAAAAPGLAGVGPAPRLTWLLLHIQQGDVIVQVGQGALGRAAPSPLRSGKHVPGEVQGALAATLLVAATERVGRGVSPEGLGVRGGWGRVLATPGTQVSHRG